MDITKLVQLTVDGTRLVNKTLTRTTTGTEMHHVRYGVTVAETTVDIPSTLHTGGTGNGSREVTVINHDTTASNYIRIGFATTDYKIRVYGGGDPATFCVDPDETQLFVAAVASEQDCEFIVNKV